MLSKELYNIGKKYSLICKYNIDYDRRCMLDYVCAIHVYELLNAGYPLTPTLTSKLTAILNNLVVL